MSLKPLIAVCALLSGAVAVSPTFAQYGPKLPEQPISLSDLREIDRATDSYCPPQIPYCALAPEWDSEPEAQTSTRGWFIKPGGRNMQRDPSRIRLHGFGRRGFDLNRRGGRGPKLRLTLGYRF